MHKHRQLFLIGLVLTALACGPFSLPGRATVTPVPDTPSPSPSAKATFFVTPPTFTPYPTQTSGPWPTMVPLPPKHEWITAAGENMVARLGKGQIHAADISHDGQYIVVASLVGLWLYDANTFQEKWFFEAEVPITRVAISDDSKTIAYIQQDGKVIRTPLDNPGDKSEWLITKGQPQQVSWSPDGMRIAIALDSEKQVIIVDTLTGEETHTFYGATKILAWPDASTIVIDNTTGTMSINLGTRAAKILSDKEHRFPLAFSPDMTKGFTRKTWVDIDPFNEIYSLDTGDTLMQLLGGDSYARAAAWSPDGTLIAAGEGVWEGVPQQMTVWDTRTGKQLFNNNSGASIVEFSPDSQVLYGVSPGNVTAWDAHSGQVLRRLEGYLPWYGRISSAAWSPDGQTLALGTEDRRVILWDVHNQKPLETIEYEKTSPDHIRWTQDGMLLLIAMQRFGNNRGYIWDTKTREVVAYAAPNNIIPMEWSPDGSMYIGGIIEYNEDNNDPIFRFQLHDTSTGVVLWEKVGDIFTTMGWSRDGNNIVMSRKTIRSILDVKTGAVLNQIERPQIDNIIATFPDGKRVLVSLEGGKFETRDIETGKVIQTFTQSRMLLGFDRSYAIPPVISPDGSMIAIMADNYDIVIIETETGMSRLLFKGHHRTIDTIVWSPDGTMLFSASEDSTAIIWKVK